MNVTVEQARYQFCPVSMACDSRPRRECSAHKCMAWRWSEPGELEWVARLLVRDMLRIKGRLGEVVTQAVLEEFETWNPAVEHFPAPPQDKGWVLCQQPTQDDEDYFWWVGYRRDQDPDRKGFCGMVQQKG